MMVVDIEDFVGDFGEFVVVVNLRTLRAFLVAIDLVVLEIYWMMD